MPIIHQISLNGNAFDGRKYTWREAIVNSQCTPDNTWIDPLHKRPLLKGEFACGVSHLRVWQKIVDSGKNGIILEEDVVIHGIDAQEIDDLLKNHDSVWLGYRLNSMGYWYNCHAYAITPKIAKYLIDGYSKAIIPVDEWVPQKLKHKKNYFYDTPIVDQIPRSVRPSTIEDTEMLEGKDIDFRIITVATEPEKMWALEQSSKKYGVEVVNIGKDHPWRDEMTGLAGMPKIQLINEYLSTVPDDTIILFMDGYDTFLADSPETILERYFQMGANIVFGAESDCWPKEHDEHLFPDTGTKYKYLNSGLYIGKASAIHKFVSSSVGDGNSYNDDQLFCQRRYLQYLKGGFDFTIKLDYEAYIFQNHEPEIKVVNQQLWNDQTKCCGCIYHGNGGVSAKDFFVEMASKFGFTKTEAEVVSPYYLTLDYKEVAQDILVTDFLTENQCKFLIDKSESLGNWGSMDGDKFPAQEIRLKELGLWHEYERLWHEKLGKISEKYWPPMEHYGLRDAFTMRYTTDTQTSLALHTDASLVTGSVKLNSDYEGAELIFPRQDFSNIKVKNGQCILFPAQVTHGHYVNELKSGVKYSLTMWTSRYSGDVNG